MKHKKINFIIVFFLVIALSIFPILKPIHSESPDDLEDQIEEQEDALDKTKESLENLKKALANSKKDFESSKEGLPKLEAEIKNLELKLKINKKSYELLKQQNKLKATKHKKLDFERAESVKDSYKTWRSVDHPQTVAFEDLNGYTRFEYYETRILGASSQAIDKLSLELEQLTKDIKNGESLLSELNKDKKELEKKKAEVLAQINNYNNLLAQNSNLQSQLTSIQNKRDLLLEQQAAAAVEDEQTQDPPPTVPPSDPVENGFYFSGKGRDLYQGHGVGMSQWGAYGAAQKGWSASKILTFYYKSTSVKTIPGKTINVQGYGSMSINKYAAGLGEVPNKACGTAAQAAENPAKYVKDNTSTPWDCWPEEAIKAQVIAAKSYGVNASQPICTTAACQVYAGGTAKQWAADETKDQFVVSNGSTHNGQIINALYSSDNSQGAGTANNDTIFQTFGGDGTPYSYLRAVNDTGTAATTQWTNWVYQTYSYNFASILNIFKFVANDPKSTATGYTKDSVRNLIAGTTKITAITFERDPSSRVKKVWIKNQSGTQRSIGGWWFKNVWNGYQADKQKYDYIFSQTFFLNNQ